MNGLVKSLSEAYSSTIPQHIRSQVTGIIVAKLKLALAQQIDTTATSAIKTTVVKIVGTSVSSPVAARVAMLIVKTLGTTLKPLLVKLLASSAFKAAVLAKIKAIVVASVVGTMVHMLAAKFGLSAGAAFAWILLPLLFAWLTYEAINFPAKLGDKVSQAVASDLAEKFEETSRDIAERLVEMVLIEGVAAILADLQRAGEISELISEAVAEAR